MRRQAGSTPLPGFLPLVWGRLRSRPLLFLLLIAAHALTIGFAASIPLFAASISQRALQQEIDLRAHVKGWPIFSVRLSAQPTAEFPMDAQQALLARDWLRDELRRAVGLPIIATYVELQSPMYRLAPAAGDDRFTSDYLAGVAVVAIPDVESRLQVREGAPFGQSQDPTRLAVWAEASLAERLALRAGDLYELGDLYSAFGQSIPVQIAGLWEAVDPHDPFWVRPPPEHFANALLTTPAQFEAIISPLLAERTRALTWYFVCDDRRLNLDDVQRYTRGLAQVAHAADQRLPGGRIDCDPREDLQRGYQRKIALSLILLAFSLPILVILIYFLASLAASEARDQEMEIAILASRGASSGQILLIAALEGLAVAGMALLPGLGMALGMAHLLGLARGFLDFAPGPPLPVSPAALDDLPIILAIAAGLAVRLGAALRASRVSVLARARGRARPPLLLTGARLLALASLILATAYAYRQLQARGALALASLSLLDPRQDPLIILAPTLFIFTAPLLAAEAFVWLLRPLDRLARWLPAVSYLACANLARAGGQYRAPAYRLALCLTLGVFYASVAHNADRRLIDLLRHEHGADLTFRVGGEAEEELAGWSDGLATATELTVVPNDDYVAIPGVLAATRLGDFEVTLRAEGRAQTGRLLAIERVAFPQVAYFGREYAGVSLGDLMNRLARAPEGVLLPAAFARALGIRVDDALPVTITLSREAKLPIRYQVVGFFDHFPTWDPREGPLLIGNLDYLELNAGGSLPYHMWLRLEEEADGATVMGAVRRLQANARAVKDLQQRLRAEEQRLERRGIFGMVSACFIAGVILSIADLLLYTTYLLRERALAHAILQALGLSRRSVLNMVVIEQAIAALYSLGAGVVCGVQAATLYAPFYPLGGSVSAWAPPFTPSLDWQRIEWMAIAVAGALLAAELVVLARMTRARLFEVLRMGEAP